MSYSLAYIPIQHSASVKSNYDLANQQSALICMSRTQFYVPRPIGVRSRKMKISSDLELYPDSIIYKNLFVFVYNRITLCYIYICFFHHYLFVDVDECALGVDACDVNSVCMNNNGSYTCVCNAGYMHVTRTTCTGLYSTLQCHATNCIPNAFQYNYISKST